MRKIIFYITRLRLATWSAPARGDIVVFFSPADEVRLVKRVVGLPGDRVALRDNRLLVNGVAAYYEPLDAATCNQIPVAEQPQHTFAREALGAHPHPVMGTPALPALRSFDELTVPPDGRLSAQILIALPFATGALINIITPAFMSILWTDPVGIRLVGGALFIMALGVLWMRKIIRIRV